jgi:hypothetical protein
MLIEAKIMFFPAKQTAIASGKVVEIRGGPYYPRSKLQFLPDGDRLVRKAGHSLLRHAPMLHERRRPCWLCQAGEILSMHQVRAHESSGVEQGLLVLRYVSQQAQRKTGDERDGGLNTDGVLETADELRDFQGLFHHAKEQFDLPTPLREIGNLLRGRV